MRCPAHVPIRESLTTTDEPEPAPAPAPAPDDRIDAAGRDRAAEEVRDAYVDGLVTVEELEDVLAAVYAARTAGDLAAATAFVPGWWRQERTAARRRAGAERARRLGWRRNAGIYLAVMALLVGIWLVSASADGAGHPWFLWPALGWGIPLWAGRPRRRGVPSGLRTSSAG